MVRTTAEKLRIKPNTELLLGPCSPAQRGLLDPLPDGVTVVDGIDRDSIWARAEDFGWTLSGNISLSETWSSVRFKRKN